MRVFHYFNVVRTIHFTFMPSDLHPVSHTRFPWEGWEAITWPCQKHWCLLLLPLEDCVSKSLSSGFLSRGKDQGCVHTGANGRTLGSASFSWSQAEARCYQSFSDVCLCNPRVSKSWTFKPAFSMRPANGREGEIPFLVGAKPGISSFANIPVTPPPLLPKTSRPKP